MQSTSNRQGSSGVLPPEIGERLSAEEEEVLRRARAVYERRLATGVAREQARKDLPLSTYTEAYWKVDLHNLLHFIDLRMDAQAQQEIRAYATVIGEQIVARWVPVTWEAFLDYRKRALTLSSLEIDLVSALAAGDAPRALAIAAEHGLVNRTADGRLAANVERAEIDVKLRRLGWIPPWDRQG